MLLILFLKVEIEHTFVFPEIMLHTGEKSPKTTGFSKSTLKASLRHLIENCYFMVGNSSLSQKIDIPMGIEPDPFCANLSLYTYENEYMSELIAHDKVKARYFHAPNATKLIDDRSTLNDVYKDIYPP